ncbi:hypothetical protein SUDANB58_00458 [Streptomyces sp. enrichment culture]
MRWHAAYRMTPVASGSSGCSSGSAPGRRNRTRPLTSSGSATPKRSPSPSSSAIFPKDASAWPPAGPAATIRISTNGSASPSLTPLSTFSNCRSFEGTSLRPTMAEANTGSVGARTAPTRKDVVQSSPTRQWVISAMPAKASGMPSPRARAGYLQFSLSLGNDTCMPSVNSTANNARSAVTATMPLSGAMWTRPGNPSLTSAPPTRKRNEVDSTVRAATPESRTATSRAVPKTATSTTETNPDRPQAVVVGFAAAIAVGTALLMLPLATPGPDHAGLPEASFTATSAVCVTGLVVVDTPTHWSGFGQVVILVLIQLGGLGIMAFASVLGVLVSRRMGLRARLTAAAETKTLGLGDVRAVVTKVVKGSPVSEAIIALLLTLRLGLG